MATGTISLEVDAAAAKAFESASDVDRRKIQLLLDVRLRELTMLPSRSLREVMDDIGRNAEARGLTPELLES